jgi:hypothetical protein
MARKQSELTQQKNVAARVLPNMEANLDFLDMGEWASGEVGPDDDPAACGTALCAAGWTAHELGWTVYADGSAHHPTQGWDEVFGVAMDALCLSNREAGLLFYSSPKTAIRVFREMAAGNEISEEMIRRAD